MNYKKQIMVTIAICSVQSFRLSAAPSSMAVISQVDLAELQELRNEVKYLRTELRSEATAARAAREEAKKYFDALIKLSPT